MLPPLPALLLLLLLLLLLALALQPPLALPLLALLQCALQRRQS